MSKKVILGLLLGTLVVGAGVYYFLTRGDETPTEEPAVEVEAVEVGTTEEEAVEQEGVEVTSEENTDIEAQGYEDWKHLENSLTKYLIWWGEEVAMVENCPGGYSEIYYEGSGVYRCDDWDNRWLQFEWLDGTEVPVTIDAGEYFLWDWTNPGGSSFQQTMTADEKYWIYLDTWSDSESQLMAYNVSSATQETLMSFVEIDWANLNWCSGIRFFGWNEAGNKLGVVVQNETADDTYPEETKVFILTIEDGKLVKKSKYNLHVLVDCSPNNGPAFGVDWVDNDTIGYYNPDDNPYGDYTKPGYDPEYLEQFFWSDDRWVSEYARYYDVD